MGLLQCGVRGRLGNGGGVGGRPLIKSRVALEPSCPLSQETQSPWLAGLGLWSSKLFHGAHTGASESSSPAPARFPAGCGFSLSAPQILPAALEVFPDISLH